MDDQIRIPGPPNIGKLMTVAIEQIVAAPSRLDEEKVAELMDSILAVGLLQPILVVASKVEEGAEHLQLVAGRHRLEAVKRLGLAKINCTVLEYHGQLWVELVRIDENLIRNVSSAAEHALLTGGRKKILTELAAQDGTLSQFATPSRQALRRAGQSPGPEIGSVRDQAKKTGESKDKIQRSIMRFEKLGVPILESIIGTSLDKGAELDALMMLREAVRDDLINRVAAGEAVSASRVLREEKRLTMEESQDQSPVRETPVREIEQAYTEFVEWLRNNAVSLQSNDLYEHAVEFYDVFYDAIYPDDEKDAPERTNEHTKKKWFNWGKDRKPD